MLTKLIITMEKPCEDWDVNSSSIFHGVLMEQVEFEYGEMLHKNGVKPYAQNVRFASNQIIWTITTLNMEAREKIITPLMNPNLMELDFKHKSTKVKIHEKRIEEKSYDTLMQETYFAECERYVTIKFTSPTAFKSDGKYQFYPTEYHITNSIIQKFDKNSSTMELTTDNILDEITNNIYICRYNLRSTVFHLEGVRIPAFVGTITIRINGPQQLVNLVNMLFAYSEYCGIGIKCSLGMGKVEIIKKEGDSNAR